MYETKDDIPEAVWEYVESWFEEEETNESKELPQPNNPRQPCAN